jgi:hypothetical protein
MTAYASASYSLAAPMPEIDSLAKLRAALERHGAKPLVFHYGARAIASGYHVTEVKAADLASLDCGANPERWRETVIQLWDIERPHEAHMTAAKFLGILAKVSERVPIDEAALLIFEVGDSSSPMQVFTVGRLDARDDRVDVTLAPRPATCKPRQRGLEAVPLAKACCGSATSAAAPCCP